MWSPKNHFLHSIFRLLKTLLCLLFLEFILIATPPKSFAQQNSDESDFYTDEINFYSNNKDFSRDDLVVLQANIGGFFTLEETIVGYSLPNKQLFLSLKDFIRVLELPITVRNDNMAADGWFIDEKRLFSLNLYKNQCVSNNKKFSISQDDVAVLDGDIFVNIKTLRKWFALDLSFDLRDQEIVINSGGLLPIETRFERQAEWQKLNEERERAKEAQDKNDSPTETLRNTYKLASIPFGDIAYTQDYSKSKTTSNSTSRLSALLAGDFLYLNHQFFTTIQDKKLTNARLTSGRRDPDGKLLGPLRATEFFMGDVQSPELPLVARSQSGKGATISNYPLEYVNAFNKVFIRGNAQPDWDVELYRNDSLLLFQKIPITGIYEFVDVPLVLGLNIIKLVFYGPFGQKYQETRRFMSGDNLLEKNKLYYRFAANKNKEDLIKIKPQDPNVAKDPSEGVGRFFSEIGYGVTKTTSVVANFLRIPDNFSSKQSDFAGLSVRSSFWGVSGRLDNTKNLESDRYAQEASLQTMLFDYSLSTTFDRFDKGFVSEIQTQSNDPISNATIARIDGPLKIPFMNFPSRISFIGTRTNFFSKEFRNELENEISLGLSSKLSLTENIKYTSNSAVDGDQGKTITGNTLMSYLFSSKLSIRGSLSYDMKPVEHLNNVSISSSYNFGNNLNFSLTASHQLARNNQDELTTYSPSISKSFNKFLLSLGGNYNSDGDYGANLNLSTSFGYDLKHNIGVLSGVPIASSGAVAAKVFLDNNNNGVFDDGDEPLENIDVLVNGGAKRIKTNDEGVAFITNIQSDITSSITINSDSLPDPFLIVRKKAVIITAHSGIINDILFPVSRVGEISGYVKIDKAESAANVELELIDKNSGKVAYKAKSGYDGYYIFDMIPFGKYHIRISPTQSKRLRFESDFESDLEFNDSNEIMSDINFTINYKTIPPWTQYKTGKINKINKPSPKKFDLGKLREPKPKQYDADKINKTEPKKFNLKKTDKPEPKKFNLNNLSKPAPKKYNADKIGQEEPKKYVLEKISEPKTIKYNFKSVDTSSTSQPQPINN